MTRALTAVLFALIAWTADAAPSLAADDADARVVFTRSCDVWLAPLSGAGAENLTSSAGCEFNPTISADGRHVAWGTLAGVEVLDRTTGSRTAIPGGQSPDISPVSDEITFSVSEAGVTDVYVAALDGTGRRKLTNSPGGDVGGNRFPRWSDDGAEIIVSSGDGVPFCRVDRGGYDDLYPSYRLLGVAPGGGVTELLSEPLTGFYSGQRGGGILAYVRQALEPADGSGYCVTEPTAPLELVVAGAVVDSAPAIPRISVAPDGDVVWQSGASVRYLPAGGAARTLFAGGQPDIAVGTRGLRARARITAAVDGPGVVQIRPGDAECADECAELVTGGDDVTVRAVADEPNGGFVGFRNCPGPVTYGAVGTCRFAAGSDVTVTAVFDPVPSYAPLVSFHPGERHWPMDPSEFVRRSSLAFANPNGPHGRDCPTKDAQVVRRGKVVSSWLAKGRYAYRYCSGMVRRGAQAPGRKVTLTSGKLTAPSETKGKAKVNWNGGGRWGFYLNLDNDAWRGKKPPNVRRGAYPNAPAMIVDYVPRRYITYWFFYGRNHAIVAGVKDVHEGDWERIAVRLDSRNQARAAGYWQHLCDADVHSWDTMRADGAIAGRSHPRVYVAKGAHASYHVPRRRTAVSCPPWVNRGVGDEHPGGGVTWTTWQRGAAGFREAKKQSWYGFGGSWGSETAEGTKRFPGPFWGPLGPGPRKAPAPKGW